MNPEEKHYAISYAGFVALVVIFVLTLYACSSKADEQPEPIKPANAVLLLPKCQNALGDCLNLSQTQDAQITILKDEAKALKSALAGPHPEVPQVVWGVTAGTLGGAMGGEMANGKQGLALGALTGAIIGLAVGLIAGGGK
jgi:hypothetical protein